MSKITIRGSEYADEELTVGVCSHLEQVLQYLTGNKFEKYINQASFTDKGGAHTLKINKVINFRDIENKFEIPHYIELSEKYKSIICRKCWCDIEGK